MEHLVSMKPPERMCGHPRTGLLRCRPLQGWRLHSYAQRFLLLRQRRFERRQLWRLQMADAAAAHFDGQASALSRQERISASRAGRQAPPQQLGKMPLAVGALDGFVALFRRLRQSRQQIHLRTSQPHVPRQSNNSI